MTNLLIHDERMTLTDWLFDLVIALGAFGFGCLQLTLAVNLLIPDEVLRRLMGIDAMVPTPAAIVAVAVTTFPLVLRRRCPWPALVIVLLAWAFFQTQMGAVSMSLIGPLVAVFTVAYTCSRAQAVAAGVGACVVVLVAGAASPLHALASLTLVQNLAFVAAAALAGYALHVRQDYLRAAEDRAADAERRRETEAQRRVEEERVRIAREVHDITAHSLSAVSIQAAAAERLIDRDPEAAREAIAAARATAKGALEEIRAMIGVLRAGDAGAETRPTEGTDRLPDLVAYLEGAGVAAQLRADGYRREGVPAYVDVALFGIAREAVTNVVRHAGATRATITLEPDGSDVVLTVADDGRGADGGALASGGHGIEGMRERVHLLGGAFQAGPGPAGGFSVSARIPLVPHPEGANGHGA
ncbi:MAG: two-component sensor histidine kinase [Eggerthellaceae bacterium]|nr:two-component sensor histidine kinase [Eggerthellaceae bacterium]